jgi:hypothetical protein
VVHLRYLAVLLLVGLLVALCPAVVRAADQNYFTFVSLVRSRDRWRAGRNIEFLTSQIQLIQDSGILSTWLLDYESLTDPEIVSQLKDLPKGTEIGLLMEVGQKLAFDSYVNYDWQSEKWERADKLFLSGYEPQSRDKLIDTEFSRFKSVFGYFPKSVGAWYIDGYSLEYMHRKYGVEAVLGLADQYVTDGYQEWGQYIGEPYYPSVRNVLEPAENQGDKLDIVKTQWAPREPYLSYGIGPEFSNFSVQINDYDRGKGLGPDYIAGLLAVYTKDVSAKVAQVTLGLEVGELDAAYLTHISALLKTTKELGLSPVTMVDFASVYKHAYPDVSPPLTIKAFTGQDGIIWYQSPYYRAAILKQAGKSYLVDLHFYHLSRLRDNDQTVRDQRQNLYRVIPAVVDQISLGNRLELPSDEVNFGLKQLNLPGHIPITSSCKNISISLKDNQTVISSADNNSDGQSGYPYASFSWSDRLRQFGRLLTPDLRLSKISGHWVVGIATGPETLQGINFGTGQLGTLRYKYPILESFRQLKKMIIISSQVYGQQEDQLAGCRIKNALLKDSPYGIDHLMKELDRSKQFENSGYLVVRQS